MSWIDFAMHIFSWALGVVYGGAVVATRFHRRAEGWRYLAAVARRRPITGVDPYIAFADDSEVAAAIRRDTIAADEVES